MATTRKCGFCRQAGHFTSKCPERLGKIELIRLHVGMQRRNLFQLLKDNGYGEGAIAYGWDWQEGNMIHGIVTAKNIFDSLTFANQFVDCRNIKYSKKCSVNLYTYDGYTPDVTLSQHDYAFNRNIFHLPITPFEGTGERIYCNIPMGKLKIGLNRNRYIAQNDGWERYGEVVSPSFDGEWDDSILQKPFHVHDRLLVEGGRLTAL